MQSAMLPRVKICCIRSHDEARMAIQAGASALGLVSAMPSGPGVISEASIASIAAAVPPLVASFLLTSRTDAAGIVAQQRRCGTSTVQICDRLHTGTYADLRRGMPGIRIVQVVHVTGREALEKAVAIAPHVDALLLDSGRPDSTVRELGGTGRTHDWRLSFEIREAVDVPVFLAGGLHSGNVAAAIREVQPFAVDICSGVRTGDRLDPGKLAEFIEQVIEAGAPRS
ncbi:MAG: phosphoribosylanthranilate isomerase [Candidatus Krumholzibacteriia bacterium]